MKKPRSRKAGQVRNSTARKRSRVPRSRMSVMVLGIGGNISQGILKALALSTLKCRVVGGCISPLAIGLYTVDRAYVTPQARDPAFLDWLIATCRAEGVKAILSGVEPVLTVLAHHAADIRKQTGAVAIVSTPAHLHIGGDKLVTCQWLQEHGFHYPRFAASEDRTQLKQLADECGYPLIAKPRKGKGGYGVIEIRNASDLEYISQRPDYVVQEYLGDPDSEYTAGCFCDRNGRVRGALVMQRELQYGTTIRARVAEFPEVRAEAIRIAAELRPIGPCNIQLRLSNGRPVCFEINVRFSGTTPVRARLGFNEVHEALVHFVLGKPASDLPLITRGTILRYWNEMYIDPKAHMSLDRTGRLDNPHAFDLLVEDYGRRP